MRGLKEQQWYAKEPDASKGPEENGQDSVLHWMWAVRKKEGEVS